MNRSSRKRLALALTLSPIMAMASILWSFEALGAPIAVTIWPSTAIPAVAADADTGAVELGVKFRADSAGSIAGIRFYKGGTNTGTHVGNLWTSAGTRLATATFANETASGWQQVNFTPPVAIAANTVYVASYHTNTGHYSVNQNYFTASGVDSAPLHALANGVSGVNGVYRYGSASVFPSQGWNASNYWVDVLFTTDTTDTTPPTVTAFAIPATATALTVPITSFAASDNVGVAGYLATESATAPAAGAAGWSASAPTSYTFAAAGAKTLYGWAKDAAGNISASRSASVAIAVSTTDTTRPTVSAFTIPTAAAALTVPITGFVAADNVAVTGYMVKETSTNPAAGATGWSPGVPASYTFATAGRKTLYAWAKDAAGNVSARKSASVTITLAVAAPEPPGWYAGDMHVHRSCGGSAESLASLYSKMSTNNLAVVSVLADMGNGEVQNPVTDLPLVNGEDASVSTPGRIVHWDGEWHWDATYSQYAHQALGGHLVALGLSQAQQIWDEYTYPIIDWAHRKTGIAGFAHMQYLDDGIPQTLDCCKPIEYPVEVALGTADFISEDVSGSDSLITAYYRLLNTGFRPGLAAGTDYPCGVSTLGSLLTYAQVANGQMTYDNWIAGIANGRTVVSRNGHNEFLALTVNGTATPGDEIALASPGAVPVAIRWTASQNLSGTIELVQNGAVVASQQASVASGASATFATTADFAQSGWLAARRMDSNGHRVHTAAVFVTVGNKPIRASAADAEHYVAWIDDLLQKTAAGGVWGSYFPTKRAEAQARYLAARTIYRQRALDAGAARLPPTVAAVSPVNGASDVRTRAGITATFSNTMSAATIDGSTFVLKDSSGIAVPAQVSYDSATRVAVLAPLAPLGFAAAYSATVKGGVDGVTDDLGTALAADYSWSFATASQANDTYRIWNEGTLPAVLADADTGAVELGVRFRSQVGGYVTGLSFYKGPSNTGTHVGSLWSNAGTLLASVPFQNETASGWQYQALPVPVAIAAETTYVASYHTNVGHYSADSGYFTAAGLDNSPLRALRDGEDGANGVYRYSAGSAFPNATWGSSNYWVDVEFRQ